MAFNDEQLQAINSDSSKIAVIAGAGAGKTTLMIARISRLVKAGVDPTSILALTFTNAAAAHMREKYKMENPGLQIPEFRTFHAFCYSIIVKDYNVRTALGYSLIPSIADDVKVKWIEKNAEMQSGIKLTEDQKAGKGFLSPKVKKDIEIYRKTVDRLLKKENLITFDILCESICKMFINKDQCILQYREKYKYLFVDEFQDTDPRQFRFVSSFPEDCHWFFVFDVLQSLYAFRGADSSLAKMMSKNPDFEKIKLYQNYRSTQQICDYANKFAKSYADESYRIEMHGQRDGDPVEVHHGSMTSYDEPVDADHLDALIDRVRDLKDEAAILCRTNKEINFIANRLKDEKIPYTRDKKDSDEFENILRSVMDNDFMKDWLATFLTSDRYADYIRQSTQVENPDLNWFLNLYGTFDEIRKRTNTIGDIRKILSDKSVRMKAKCEQIAKIFKIELDFSPFEGKNWSSMSEFIDDFIELIDKDKKEHTLVLSTCHGSKGLEWNTVFVMGVGDFNFKLDSEDNKNVAYVAYTRAKNHLIVYGR